MAEIHFENRDCVEAMKEFPDNFFDLAIVDPPYGIGVLSMQYTKTGARRSSRNSAAACRDYRKQGEWDIKPNKEYFTELMRASKRQIIWGGITLPICSIRQNPLSFGTRDALTQCQTTLQIANTHGAQKEWVLHECFGSYGTE